MGKTSFKKGIVIIGAGNVATHLAVALQKNKFTIRSIYSRSISSAEKLANKLNVSFANSIEEIPSDADLYIVSIKDEAIENLLTTLKVNNGVVVHTAGSIPLNVFHGKSTNYGVFYPLQTFSRNRELDFSKVPICIEANSSEVENKLFHLASCLTESVYKIDSEKRMSLHLAAVFACNFANHMFSIATNVLEQSDISFDLLKPLIEETAKKAIDCDPIHAQTGPAIRNDQNVIKKHLDMLNDNNEYQKIYSFVSGSIYKMNQKKNKE